MGSCTFNSSVGNILFTYEDETVCTLSFNVTQSTVKLYRSSFELYVIDEIQAYLKGKLCNFSIPFVIEGTHFQQRVWEVLSTVPYGKVITYGEVAELIHSNNAYQAVGNACGANKVPLLIPCHRVVSKRGIGGFSAGLNIKEKLLAIEGVIIP